MSVTKKYKLPAVLVRDTENVSEAKFALYCLKTCDNFLNTMDPLEESDIIDISSQTPLIRLAMRTTQYRAYLLYKPNFFEVQKR